MTDLIEKNDPRYFSQTSNEPYDRHHYKIVSATKTFVVDLGKKHKNGGGIIVIHQQFKGAVIHVIDKPKKKPKGF